MLGIFGCWGNTHIRREKWKKSMCQRLDRGTSNKCAQFQGLSLKNGVDIWTFVQLSAKVASSLRNYLYLVYIRCWAIHMTSYWLHALSSWNICSRLWAIHALENLEAAGPKETVVKCPFIYTSTAWLSLTSLKSWLVGTFFRRQRQSKVLTKLSGYVTLFHCSWRPARYQICDILVAFACGVCGWQHLFGVYARFNSRICFLYTDASA